MPRTPKRLHNHAEVRFAELPQPYTREVKLFKRDRQHMIHLLETLNSPEGAWPSALPGVFLLRTSRALAPVPVMYEPCIVIVAQGKKRFHLPDRGVQYDARNYLVLTVPVPADCETLLERSGPFLAVGVRIDLALLSDLLLSAEGTELTSRPKRSSASDGWVSAPRLTPALSNVTVRLLECLHSPTDARVLGPQLIRELTYRVLCGDEGGALENLLLARGTEAQIHRVLHRMHTEYACPLDIPSLAQDAAMSVSALHAHFKNVTATSPMQYLKMIRLHKARSFMVQDALGASVAAERVGYDSPSQFSREFKRLFGASPAEEAHRVRATLGGTLR